MTVRAAGILFKTKDGRALFLKRGPGGDHPGEWCFPGGKAEDDDSGIEDTAKREATEEIGKLPAGTRSVLTRSISEVAASAVAPTSSGPVAALPLSEGVDFTTFLQEVVEPFDVVPDGEHVGFAWAPVTEPPEPLHPGCRIALDRLSMDELGVARAIAAGQITSPQRYKNVTLWAMRITGTGVALRRAVKDDKGNVIRGEEFPFRDPAHYLNDEFLARCNGLAVVWVHPEKKVLDSKAFVETIIGAIMLPYIRNDEVWGIAKIYDDDANKAMAENDLSTSPGVVVSDPNSPSYKLGLEDGSTLLIEGKPSLLDHLAICERGVWDKGGEPAGILNDSQGDRDMTEDEQKKADEEKARKDAEAADEKTKLDATLNKMLTCMDSVAARMDAFEDRFKKADAEGKTAEELAADKVKKDAEAEAEKKKADAEKAESEEKERADAARADADETRKRIDAIEAMLPKERTDADLRVMTDAQVRADSVFRAFGKEAPRFLNGEAALPYRRRLAREFQEHSPAWKPVDLEALNDSVLAVAETAIYNDAMAAAMDPKGVEDGGLRMVAGQTPSGHREIKFYGRPSAWMGRFAGSKRFATRINPLVKQEIA